ncbi:MAG: hypothetical protein HY072_07205 [Deltaproteobacteria bacterium]|nr:hypothetical protein [Deltaproteobacteria bacterium]
MISILLSSLYRGVAQPGLAHLLWEHDSKNNTSPGNNKDIQSKQIISSTCDDRSFSEKFVVIPTSSETPCYPNATQVSEKPASSENTHTENHVSNSTNSKNSKQIKRKRGRNSMDPP